MRYIDSDNSNNQNNDGIYFQVINDANMFYGPGCMKIIDNMVGMSCYYGNIYCFRFRTSRNRNQSSQISGQNKEHTVKNQGNSNDHNNVMEEGKKIIGKIGNDYMISLENPNQVIEEMHTKDELSGSHKQTGSRNNSDVK